VTDQLPEIREADAPPEIAAIYDDIRRAIGIPLVNLIYRHFAAMPGTLPWVWHVARQPITSGTIEAAQRDSFRAQSASVGSQIRSAPSPG
jgi:hypothetical protein